MQNATKAQLQAKEAEARTQHLAATARAEQQYEATVAAALASARPANVSASGSCMMLHLVPFT